MKIVMLFLLPDKETEARKILVIFHGVVGLVGRTRILTLTV